MEKNIHIKLEDQAVVDIDFFVDHLLNADFVMLVLFILADKIGDLAAIALVKKDITQGHFRLGIFRRIPAIEHGGGKITVEQQVLRGCCHLLRGGSRGHLAALASSHRDTLIFVHFTPKGRLAAHDGDIRLLLFHRNLITARS